MTQLISEYSGKFSKFGIITGALILACFSTEAYAESIDFSQMQLNGGASVTAGVLDLASNTHDTSASAFLKDAVSPEGLAFTSSFDLALNQSPFFQADGIAFVIQSVSSSAIGAAGGGIGAQGIPGLVGIGFQSYVNNHSSIFTTADTPYGGTEPLGNFILGDNAMNAIHVTVNYANSLLSYTASNAATGQVVNSSLSIDLASLGDKLYFGFTGATGSLTAVQAVSNFDLTTNSAVAVPGPEAGTGLAALAIGGLGAMAYRRKQKIAA